MVRESPALQIADHYRASYDLRHVLVPGVAETRRGVGGEQVPERAGPPACFFFELARCRFGGRLAFLDLADRDLPAPAAGDEAVPPDQQHPPVAIDGGNTSAGRGADEAVVQVAAIRKLDISDADIEPLILVQRLLRTNLPLHGAAFLAFEFR